LENDLWKGRSAVACNEETPVFEGSSKKTIDEVNGTVDVPHGTCCHSA